jgi:hypothetical protein
MDIVVAHLQLAIEDDFYYFLNGSEVWRVRVVTTSPLDPNDPLKGAEQRMLDYRAAERRVDGGDLSGAQRVLDAGFDRDDENYVYLFRLAERDIVRFRRETGRSSGSTNLFSSIITKLLRRRKTS